MTSFVLDASVTMRWILEAANAKDQAYAWNVLDQLSDTDAIVPSLWYLEVRNVLLSAEKDRRTHPVESERFIEQLESLRIIVDSNTSTHVFDRTMAIARSSNLTSYDAAYLELSIREGVAISSLDHTLRKAATRLEIPIFLA